jgi:phosphoglycerate kinase
MVKRALTDIDVKDKKVLVRVDFNVPIEQGIDIVKNYDHRLRSTLPTIEYLIGQSSKVILCSHLGRPKGQIVENLRLAPIGDRLSELLRIPVTSLEDCVGTQVNSMVDNMDFGDIILLENLRFYPGEEKNDPDFAKQLSGIADVFIMDAFGVCHRPHASVVGVTEYIPSAMGVLVQKEIEAMTQALDNPKQPLAVLMGGAKVSDKILVLEHLLDKLSKLLIGGGMAVTFLRAAGYGTGASQVEEDRLHFAQNILEEAQTRGIAVHLPQDVVIANKFDNNPDEIRTVPVNKIPDDWFVMDIGPSSAREFTQSLEQCKTIIWNGPMGVFEMDNFSHGTRSVGKAIAELPDVTTVLGGGSTAEAAEALGIIDKLTHVSTGGGASLEFLEGKELPGIAALPDK